MMLLVDGDDINGGGGDNTIKVEMAMIQSYNEHLCMLAQFK